MLDQIDKLTLTDKLSRYTPDKDSSLGKDAEGELSRLTLSGIKEFSKITLPTSQQTFRDAIIGIQDGKVVLSASVNLPEHVISKFILHLEKKYGITSDEIEIERFGKPKIKNESNRTPKELEIAKRHFLLLKSKLTNYSPQEGILYKESDMKKEQEIANQVFLALANTISNATEICISKNTSEYTFSAEVFSALLEMIDMLGTSQLKITRDLELEKEHINSGEKEIYHFNATEIKLSNGQVVEWLKILIRPSDLLGSKSGTVNEVIAQARFKAQYKIKGSVGVANIRIDPPDPRQDNNIVIDLEINDRKKNRSEANLIDKLDLNQQAGHHFNSGVNISDFGDLNPSDIHRAIANRLIQISAIQ